MPLWMSPAADPLGAGNCRVASPCSIQLPAIPTNEADEAVIGEAIRIQDFSKACHPLVALDGLLG